MKSAARKRSPRLRTARRVSARRLIVGPGKCLRHRCQARDVRECGIDALAGPSEIAIVASGDANADLVAADMLAQAEHDDDARALLITDDRTFALAVSERIDARLTRLETAATARLSLERSGGYVLLALEDAPGFCNRLAPEHLSLQGTRAEALAPRCSTYGTLFIGEAAAEVFGDYGSGPNHVLPTGGTARFSSGLSVMNFLTLRTFERALGKADRRIANDAAILAQAEGLAAHRDAALARTYLTDAAPGAPLLRAPVPDARPAADAHAGAACGCGLYACWTGAAWYCGAACCWTGAAWC